MTSIIKENYRAKEASLYLGVAISTIWLYAKQGKLTPIKLSSRVTVFKKEDLDHLVSKV
jgi:predicted site-specific integrase-resolvase